MFPTFNLGQVILRSSRVSVRDKRRLSLLFSLQGGRTGPKDMVGRMVRPCTMAICVMWDRWVVRAHTAAAGRWTGVSENRVGVRRGTARTMDAMGVSKRTGH